MRLCLTWSDVSFTETTSSEQAEKDVCRHGQAFVVLCDFDCPFGEKFAVGGDFGMVFGRSKAMSTAETRQIFNEKCHGLGPDDS